MYSKHVLLSAQNLILFYNMTATLCALEYKGTDRVLSTQYNNRDILHRCIYCVLLYETHADLIKQKLLSPTVIYGFYLID